VVAKCDHLQKLKFSPGLPYAFTEHGAVMLASVLNSERAIQMNILVIRVFNKMRKILENHLEVLERIEKIEEINKNQDKKILLIFEYLEQLEQEKTQRKEQGGRKRIGFKPV
jgi:phage regulator Rha-like protein